MVFQLAPTAQINHTESQRSLTELISIPDLSSLLDFAPDLFNLICHLLLQLTPLKHCTDPAVSQQWTGKSVARWHPAWD